MKPLRCAAGLVLALVLLAPAVADDPPDEAGFVPLFDGKDLGGWVNVNCAPGTFFVKDGEIITTGKPTGFLRTERQYENFVADFEWMHVNKKEVGNSGFFVWADPLPAVGTPYTRGIEVQVLVNLNKEGWYTSHGDLFSIWGATCKPDRPHPQGWQRCLPSENRCKGGGEWNHYRVIGRDGVLKLHVNGKEVSGLSECRPRKGYLALESEGAECHFRNLKIKELPSTDPKPDEVADVARGFRNLYTGLDLFGWKVPEDARGRWQPRDWVLHCNGKSGPLRSEAEAGDAEVIADFRFPKGGGAPCTFGLREAEGGGVTFRIGPDGSYTIRGEERKPGSVSRREEKSGFNGLKPAGEWNRLHATLEGLSLKITINGKAVAETKFDGVPPRGALTLAPEGEMDFGNLFLRQPRP
jgi:hypothetical protein